jgi:hypothetical protein
MVPEDWEREFNKNFQVHACRRGGKKGRENKKQREKSTLLVHQIFMYFD